MVLFKHLGEVIYWRIFDKIRLVEGRQKGIVAEKTFFCAGCD